MSIAVECECGRHRLLLHEEFLDQVVPCPYCPRQFKVGRDKIRATVGGSGGTVGEPRATASAAGVSPRLQLPSSSPSTIMGRHPLQGTIVLLGWIAALCGLLATACLRLDQTGGAIALGGLGGLFALAGIIIGIISSQTLAAPAIALLFCGSIAGMAMTESIKPTLQQMFPNWMGEAELLLERTRPAAPPLDQPAMLGDLQFRIRSARLERPLVQDIHSRTGTTTRYPDIGLVVAIEVRNLAKTRQLYKIRPSLLDNRGFYYKEILMPSYRLVERDLIERDLLPQQKVQEVYFFEPPAPGVEFLELELKSGVEKSRSLVVFRIPINRIERDQSAGDEMDDLFNLLDARIGVAPESGGQPERGRSSSDLLDQLGTEASRSGDNQDSQPDRLNPPASPRERRPITERLRPGAGDPPP